MSYTIVADVCEGLHDCVPCCPADCISQGQGTNGKGTSFVVIEPAACTNCGICLSICPIEGAVLDEWRPELQTPGATDGVPATAKVAVPVDAAAALARARQIESDGDGAAAAAAYEQAVACGDDQHSAEAAYRLGKLLEQRRDTDAALSVYRTALTLADSRYRHMCAWEAGALLHNRKGDLAAATEMYRQAMNSRHGEYAAVAACNLGIVLAGQGDVNGAVWAYRGAIGCAHPRQSPKAAINLGKLLEERGDTAGAITAYEQVSAQTEHSAEAAFRLGMLLDSQGDTEAAQAAYRRGLDATDSRYQPVCAINLGALLARQGDHSGAAEMYRRALKSPHDDNAALAACNLGHASARQGDRESAVAAFRQAIDYRHSHESPRAALALGNLLEESGDAAGALGAYQRVLEFDDERGAAEARNRLQRLRVAHAPDPTPAVHDAVMRWAATNIEEGKDRNHTSLAAAISRLQSESCEVKVKLSAGQSKSGRPMYGVSWLDQFHAFELSAEQERQLGIEPDTVTIQGIGGKPRGDTRQFPPVRIEGLRINNGAPVTSSAAISVAVQCDPNIRLAGDVRLRIGCVLGATGMVLSPPIGDIPPDGGLSKELRPFAEDDWTEGPVPLFVDLVVINDEAPDMRLTVVSNTLSALVDVSRPLLHHDRTAT